ncbi:MAG: hypothetical protein K6G22_06380 [Lachnospiraceae bacterium]|nr:hypothetical protein [Lachnospiraceae bacterium]
MKYDDYDLVLLNRLKGIKSIGLIGRDVSYFSQLINVAYKDAEVKDLTLHDISSEIYCDCLIIGDDIINDDMSGRLYGISCDHVYAVSKRTSIDICSNAFIRNGYEILSANNVRVNADTDNTYLLFRLKKHDPVLLPDAESLVKRYKEVFVLCPRAIKTGGPELLHQLVYHINSLGGDAYITYIPIGDGEILSHPELEKYVYGRVRTIDEVRHDGANLLVVPEGWPLEISGTSPIKKMFWWLSVDNFFTACNNSGLDPQKKTEEICENYDVIAYQSEYAHKYLLYNGADEGKTVRLSDYLNDAFIEKADTALQKEKKDIVIYNPKKGYEYTKKLIEDSDNMEFVPIQNMTTAQVRDLLETAKVYIDFGNHPGKDRIPREAAISGCIVITGMKGAAANDKDIPIDPGYKIDETDGDTKEALKIIDSCLNDYDKRIDDFREYRDLIRHEKEIFIEDIKDIFFVNKQGERGR